MKTTGPIRRLVTRLQTTRVLENAIEKEIAALPVVTTKIAVVREPPTSPPPES